MAATRSCDSCGSYPSDGADLYCNDCRHAIDWHGASQYDAYAVACDRGPSCPASKCSKAVEQQS